MIWKLKIKIFFAKIYSQGNFAGFGPEQVRPLKKTLDNQQNCEMERERYYATIHKVALQANSEKIPGIYVISGSKSISFHIFILKKKIFLFQ